MHGGLHSPYSALHIRQIPFDRPDRDDFYQRTRTFPAPLRRIPASKQEIAAMENVHGQQPIWLRELVAPG